jgi:hypothetical protein
MLLLEVQMLTGCVADFSRTATQTRKTSGTGILRALQLRWACECVSSGCIVYVSRGLLTVCNEIGRTSDSRTCGVRLDLRKIRRHELRFELSVDQGLSDFYGQCGAVDTTTVFRFIKDDPASGLEHTHMDMS